MNNSIEIHTHRTKYCFVAHYPEENPAHSMDELVMALAIAVSAGSSTHFRLNDPSAIVSDKFISEIFYGSTHLPQRSAVAVLDCKV